MNVSTHAARSRAVRARAYGGPGALRVLLLAFAAVQLGEALFMAAAPHAFYEAVGPFGARNDHYVRDVASFYGALGVGCALAVRRPSWRVPVLAIMLVEYALHSANHLLDIDSAHPAWTGYLDFVALAATSVLLAWMLALARAQARSTAPNPKGPDR
jgi:hypothetical protein